MEETFSFFHTVDCSSVEFLRDCHLCRNNTHPPPHPAPSTRKKDADIMQRLASGPGPNVLSPWRVASGQLQDSQSLEQAARNAQPGWRWGCEWPTRGSGIFFDSWKGRRLILSPLITTACFFFPYLPYAYTLTSIKENDDFIIKELYDVSSEVHWCVMMGNRPQIPVFPLQRLQNLAAVGKSTSATVLEYVHHCFWTWTTPFNSLIQQYS